MGTEAVVHFPARSMVESIAAARDTAAEAGCGLGVVLVEVAGLLDWRVSYGVLRVDEVLVALQARLGALVRQDDQVLHSGDGQYLLLLPRLRHRAEVGLATRRVRQGLIDCVLPGIDRGAVEHRLGVVYCDADTVPGVEPVRVLQRVYDALAAGLESGGAPDSGPLEQESRAAAAGTSSPARLADALRLSRELPGALERGEFELWYQPKLALAAGRCVGAEGLLRWRHPAGLRQPGEFIGPAERSGAIMGLTRAVLHMGLQQLAEWPGGERLHLALNVSAACLDGEGFVQDVRDALSIWAIAPAQLTLEITESAAMRDADTGGRLLGALRDGGVRIALDDFGTGYCSLGYLRRLAADELKIDRSFVRDILHQPGDRRLVAGIIDLAHHFGLTVVAEGVEDRETLDCLAALGCDIVQGFHIGRPMAAPEFLACLAARAAAEER